MYIAWKKSNPKSQMFDEKKNNGFNIEGETTSELILPFKVQITTENAHRDFPSGRKGVLEGKRKYFKRNSQKYVF